MTEIKSNDEGMMSAFAPNNFTRAFLLFIRNSENTDPRAGQSFGIWDLQVDASGFLDQEAFATKAQEIGGPGVDLFAVPVAGVHRCK